MNEGREAFVLDAVRTPRGRGKADGALYEVSPVDLAAGALEALQRRGAEPLSEVDDVILGCVSAAGEQGGNIARSAALRAGYGDSTPGLQINRFCASGLEAVNLAAAQIRGGFGDLFVAGGVESMSRVPMGSDGFPMAVDPQLALRHGFVPQGISADLIATKYGFTRDECDRYAVQSQKRAARAWEERRFAKSVVPVAAMDGAVLLERDEHMRPESEPETLAALEPSFRGIGEEAPGFDAVALLRHPEVERIDHVHHAGNSSGICDGAAAVLLGAREAGERLGREPRARIRAVARVGTEPTIMLTGPVPAARRALAMAGMQIGDIDLFEVNEAFASIPLLFLAEAGVDGGRVNVNGGAIAMGHPIGATGAMLLSTALDELERISGATALVAMCVGSGMGVATVLERV